MAQYKCETCGKMFNQCRGSRKSRPRFCNRDCYNQWKITRFKIPCKTCGKFFIPKTEKSKFCSRNCSAISQRKRISFVCKNCGESFKIKPYHLSEGPRQRKFCSQRCVYLSRKGRSRPLEIMANSIAALKKINRQDPEYRKKLSSAHKGVKLSPEHVRARALQQSGEKNYQWSGGKQGRWKRNHSHLRCWPITSEELNGLMEDLS